MPDDCGFWLGRIYAASEIGFVFSFVLTERAAAVSGRIEFALTSEPSVSFLRTSDSIVSVAVGFCSSQVIVLSRPCPMLSPS